ncbi:MAG: MerR family transcriptional regulator [Acidobacteria bacterium]|nr:MerR family transcriptional regulator [Acidobacteriota bacterium]
MSATRSVFRVGEFAKLAGVTVRALHHYDRVGLLRPRRGAGGYRVYTARDLEMLEQIVVLKFVGIPLRQIAGLLRAGSRSLAGTLRAQRGTLESKRQLLDRAIAAIGDLEAAVAAGADAGPQMFKRIIEVIDMQNDATKWKQEYDALVSKKMDRLRALSPDALSELRSQWNALVTEIKGALTEDPAGGRAQTFADRWTALLGKLMGQTVDEKMLASHQTREWDSRMASFVDKQVWDFMSRVFAARG